MKAPDPGFKAIVDDIAKTRSSQALLGHTFVGYRRKGFDEYVAIFKLAGNNEQSHTKYVCEQIVKNAKPGSETHEAAKKALKHWPSA